MLILISYINLIWSYIRYTYLSINKFILWLRTEKMWIINLPVNIVKEKKIIVKENP